MTVGSRSAGLAEVVGRRADWQPWLAVLEIVAEAAGDRAWRAAVPEPSSATAAPLLAGAVFVLDARLVRRWGRRLLETAAAAGGAAAPLDRLARADADTLGALLEAGLRADAGRVSALAAQSDVDADALGAIAAVVPVPLLRACADHWRERMPGRWSHGFCPVCGGWPALAEARGLERARRLRCGRCAGDWSIAWLRCPYCGMDDHTRLGGLVADREAAVIEAPPPSPPRFARSAEAPDPARRTMVETCSACRGYLKTVTTLGATAADELALLDLATVELDVAAVVHGYRRPPGLGAPLDARVRTRGGSFLAGWRG